MALTAQNSTGQITCIPSDLKNKLMKVATWVHGYKIT